MNKARLESLLREAAIAHHSYETELGHADENWQGWYAEYIMDRMYPQPISPEAGRVAGMVQDAYVGVVR